MYLNFMTFQNNVLENFWSILTSIFWEGYLAGQPKISLQMVFLNLSTTKGRVQKKKKKKISGILH